MTGHVILPGDAQYSQARRVWNHAVNAYPDVIVRCANVDDIVRAIDFAHRYDLDTAVRSGGHSFAGYGVSDGGLVIDLSTMKRVEIDPRHTNASIEPGVLAGELVWLT